MAQMTWRADPELLDDVRHAAERAGRSMNEYVTFVLRSATDPEFGADEGERVRARLARAGLLTEAAIAPVRRPAVVDLERARRAAGRGTPLSDLVTSDRG